MWFGATGWVMAALLSGGGVDEDPYLWLEEVEGERALTWVRQRNERSLARLQGDARYAATESAIREIVLAKDRVPVPKLHGGWVYNFWQDDVHVRGLWRRATLEEYRKESPAWEVLIDIDALAARENENWVWPDAAVALPPRYDRWLVPLSRGGKDAVVVREFDLTTRQFVEGGFALPEAKSGVAWIDRDTIFVSTDFGPGSLTESGYPRIARVWKRGTPLDQATTVYEAEPKDLVVIAHTVFRPEGNVPLVGRYRSFYSSEHFFLQDGRRGAKIPLPDDATFQTIFEGRAFALLRTDWKPADRTFPAGAVVALPLDGLDDPRKVELVLEPRDTLAIEGVGTTATRIFATAIEDVKGRLLALRRTPEGRWTSETQPYPDHGVLDVASADDFSDDVVVSFASFLIPSTYSLSRGAAAPALLKQAKERFDAGELTVQQHFAVSRDGTRIPYFVVAPKTHGTRIPYFVVAPKTLPAEGAPTVLDAYGGFQLSKSPFYLASIGKVWSEKGGVYVAANLRGGGEYGPRWHEAVRRENRPKVFEDLIAVAEDLVARKITTPKRLAINGGSNGGLLVGATMLKRPDLFAAVICEVPLLDMMRYTKLPPGASWIDEYGDPEDPALREVIRSYSPYQNVTRDRKYPEVFFVTSTKDDRVHPGHARKMAARMEEMGHPFLYFENIEGGHGAAANLEQYIRRRALLTTFLYQKLMDGK